MKPPDIDALFTWGVITVTVVLGISLLYLFVSIVLELAG